MSALELCQAHFQRVRFWGTGARARMIALLACVALFAACSRPPAGPRAVFEVAEVVPAGTPGAISVGWFDPALGTVLVVDPARFEVERTYIQPDSFGHPAIGFELVARDEAPFRAWTTAHVRKTVAMMADRTVIAIATIMTPLPGSGLIDFGAKPRSPAEVKALAERLAPLD